VLGLFVGYLFGTVANAEVAKANPRGPAYTPWPAAQAYIVFWLPASIALGFVTMLVVVGFLGPPDTSQGPTPPPPYAAYDDAEMWRQKYAPARPSNAGSYAPVPVKEPAAEEVPA
jgi:hypothetical protein